MTLRTGKETPLVRPSPQIITTSVHLSGENPLEASELLCSFFFQGRTAPIWEQAVMTEKAYFPQISHVHSLPVDESQSTD